MSINLNMPISWESFKELPARTQAEYIRHLMDEYGANATSLAALFSIQPLTVRRYLAAKALDVSFPVGHSMNAEQRKAWEVFIGSKSKQHESGHITSCDTRKSPIHRYMEKAVSSAVALDEALTTTDTKRANGQMDTKSITMSFSGRIDIAQISNSLAYLIGNDAVGEVEITCNLT